MSLKLYDLKTLTKSGEIPFNADGRTANVPNFNFIASKDYIAIFGIDNNIYLWDLPTRSYRGILQGHKAMVLSAVIQYDYIFSTDKEGNIIWWNIKTNKILQEFQTSLEFCEEIFLVGTQLGAKNYLFDIWDL
jgi:WD40 repeat protein